MELLLKAQIDEGPRNVCFHVNISNNSLDILLAFLVTDKPQKSGMSMVFKTKKSKHELPIIFQSGTGFYYYMEMFGLQKKQLDGEYYEFVAYKNMRFTVPLSKGDGDVDLNFSLKEHMCPYLPLTILPQEDLSVVIDHTPVSRYTIRRPGNYKSMKVFIIVVRQNKGKLNFFIHKAKRLKYKIPFYLPPAKTCDVKVIVGSEFCDADCMDICRIDTNSTPVAFNTCFTRIEYQQLNDKTLDFIKTIQGKFFPIIYFYRNKSEFYFSSIKTDHGGIMKPYKKDHNGDPYSVINGRIEGLFFSTTVDQKTLKPFPFSPFGPIRLHVVAHCLFNPDMNLYFADFYCHYKIHYVTVVLTKKKSHTDNFCADRLLKLDIYDNPFLYLSKDGIHNVMVYLGTGLRVEVFYTEAINISHIIHFERGHFEQVRTIGRGESKPEGIPKKQQCKTCNL